MGHDRSATAPIEPSGVWSLGAGGVELVEAAVAGPAIVLVPSEQVLMLGIDLPFATRRQRAASLPFAIEDRIASPLDEVHTALGEEVAPRRHLAGVVRHAVMRDWVATIAAAGLARAAIVPDALVLPVPPTGGWSVFLAGARALVRTDEGVGFALPDRHLAAAWAAAGEPACLSYGEPLPSGIASEPADIAYASLLHRTAAPALDLRQGVYAAERRPLATAWRRLALVVAGGAVAHAAIAAADTVVLDRIADERRAAVVRLLGPNAPVGDGDLVDALDQVLPIDGAGDPSPLLPLLARAAQALDPLRAEVTLSGLSFSGAALRLEVEASGLAGLQRVEAALGAAGLDPVTGATSVEGGRADAEIAVRDTGATR